jgi:hypothetical protein
MLPLFVLAATMGMSMPVPVSPDSSQCKVSSSDQRDMLAADYDSFDQSINDPRSWRTVMGRGCYETAATIIDAYLQQNRNLTDEQRRTLNFHAGQVLAFGGKDDTAAPYFAKAEGGDAEWNAYVAATLSFVKKDRSDFDTAYAQYVQVAPKSPRIAVLDSLKACFDKSYATAVACQQ